MAGAYLALGGKCEVVEGTWRPVLPVLIEFPNFVRAKAWYGSDQYKELKELRLSATKADAVFMRAQRVHRALMCRIQVELTLCRMLTFMIAMQTGDIQA